MSLSSISAHLLFALLLSSPAALAQSSAKDSGLVVNADKMDADFKSKVTSLKGNVQIVFQGQHLSADRATVDYRAKRIEAKGRVRLQSNTVYAEATRLVLNYEADTAMLEDGFIQSGQVVFEGKFIEKTGKDTYIATDAKYTACASCPPAWNFSGQKIEAELGGYARIKRPVMRIGGIPIIILPGILVPLKSSRQTGILVPGLDRTRSGGLAVSESFFWAIDRSRDLEVKGTYYEFRGFKGLANYRYVLSESSKGELGGAYIKDRKFSNEYKSFGITDDIDRWYYKYKHFYELPDNFIQRVDIRSVSDLRYLRDFPDEVQGHGASAIENKASLTKNFPGQHLSAEASYHVNLLKTYPLAENNDAVHRLPEIQYSILERRLWGMPFLFSLDATYTNFTRSDYSYDDLFNHAPPGFSCPANLARCADVNANSDILRDGEFDPATDLIRTGQRFDFRPSVSMPFQIFDIFDITPRVSYREAQYRFALDETAPDANFSRTAAQRYLATDISMRTKLSGVYGSMSAPDAVRYKHEIEPEIGFSYIPWVRRAEHGFFGKFAGQRYSRIYEPINDQDLFGLNGFQFDYHDRVFDKKLVEFAVTNRITRKRWLNGLPIYQRIGTFRLSQSYDIYEARTTRPQPWSSVDALLNIRVDNFETYTTASHNGYAKVTNTSSRVRLFNDRGNNFIQASYERIYLIDEDNVVKDRNQTENLGLGLGFKSRYVHFEGQVDYSAITNRITSWNAALGLKPPGDCWTILLTHTQVIGGDPKFSFNMSFDFGGEEVKKIN